MSLNARRWPRPTRLPPGRVLLGGLAAAAVVGSGYLDLTPADPRPIAAGDVLARAAEAAQVSLLRPEPGGEATEPDRADRSRPQGTLAERLRAAAAREQKATDAREKAARVARADAKAAKAEAEREARRAAQRKAQREAAEQRLARTARVSAAGPAVVLPVAGYALTGRFGQSGLNWAKIHTGLDFACPVYAPVRAVAAGTVVSAGWAGPYGWRTIVRHAGGLETWYAHQSAVVVRSGQVRAGDLVGLVGDTGNATGPHLHLEVRFNGAPVDPLAWFNLLGLAV